MYDNNPISAREVLSWDDAKVRELLAKMRDANGTIQPIHFSDLLDLSSDERAKFRLKILELSGSQKLDSAGLYSRLAKLAADNMNSSSLESMNNASLDKPSPVSSSVPSPVRESPESASTAETNDGYSEEYQASCYKTLQNDNARPICTHQTLRLLYHSSSQNYEQSIPWLVSPPTTESGADEIGFLLSTQLDRWIEFRLWQLQQRGGQDASDSRLTQLRILSASKLRHLGLNQVNDSFLKDLYRDKFPKRKVEPFPQHRSAVQKMAKELGLKKRISIHKNIRQQSSWEDWLEYVRLEQLDLDRLTKELQTKDELSFVLSYNKLYNTTPLSLRGISTSHTTQPKSNSIDDIEPTNNARTVEDPASTFIEETQDFVHARQRVYFQTRRVEWAIQEARALETELNPLRTIPKRKAATHAEPQAKRARV